MKRTYTPSLEELSRQYGEQYFTVTTREAGHKSEPALDYGTLEDLVSIADATIFIAYGDAADLDRYSIRISYAGRELVYIPCVGDGPDSAQVMPQPAGDTYEVREIDAWADPDGGWTYNESWHIGTFTTTGDPARALRRYLKTHHGVTFYKGRTVTEYDGDVFEIVDRATREPLFAAIPQEV
jgi:hypothetical protein